MAQVIAWAGVADLLLKAHTPDGSNRCRVCSTDGTGSAHVVWPCNLWLAAREAKRRKPR